MTESYKPPLKQKFDSICKGAFYGSTCSVKAAAVAYLIYAFILSESIIAGIMNVILMAFVIIVPCIIAILGISIIWFFGLLFLALPLWIILERVISCSVTHAIALGVFVNSALAIVYTAAGYMSAPQARAPDAMEIMLILILNGVFIAIGGMVGRFIWNNACQEKSADTKPA